MGEDRQERPSINAKLKRRAVIERKTDHLHDLGARRATLSRPPQDQLQILLAAVVANIAHLDMLGAVKDKEVPLRPETLPSSG